MSSLSVRLPDSLHQAIKEFAKKEHVSLNQFIAMAAAEKLSALTTVDYLAARANRGNKKRFLQILNQIPDAEPEDFDKL